jgi:hypothetical protein
MSWLVLRAARLARLNEPVDTLFALCPALAGQGIVRELVVDDLRAKLLPVHNMGLKFGCVRVLGIPFWDDHTVYRTFDEYEPEDEVYELEWTPMLDAIVEKVLLPDGILEVDVSNKKDTSFGLVGEGLWNFVRTKYPELNLRLNYMKTGDIWSQKQHDKMTAADEAAITQRVVAHTTERSRPAAAKAIQRAWRLKSGNPHSELGERVLLARFGAHVSKRRKL